MGEPKALLPLDDGSYLETIVRKLVGAGLETVAVVVGSQADRIWSAGDYGPAFRVDNPGWRSGMVSSWRRGLQAVAVRAPDSAAAVVALVDVPRFAVATVRGMVEAYRRGGEPVVVPRHGNERGHPVLVGRELWEEFEDPPVGGARAILHVRPERVREIDVDDPWVLRDADTPADHARMRARTQ